jgi:hypothetical protein
VVVFPPEPPVVFVPPAERPAAVKGAPVFGAAKRTLDGENRSGIGFLKTGGSGGKTTFPAGELRAFSYAAFSTSVSSAEGLRTWNGWPDLSTANK